MITHGDDIYNYKDIRLNFSSNIYNGFDHSGLFKHLTKKMSCITNYPEPEPCELERMLAEHLHIAADEIMVTNGATEAIYLIAQSFRGCRSHIVNPTFAEYAEACKMHGHAIVEEKEDLHWLCNPNNPTGKVVVKERIMKMVTEREDTVFVIDQSYDRFTNSATFDATEVTAMENVIVLHSMTKEYAIPGLRLGYVVANKRLIARLRERRMPWAVNSMAIEAGKYLVNHNEEYKINIKALLNERVRVAQKLRQTGKMDVYESDTHILLCRLHEGSAAELKECLTRDYGILIRDASNFEGLTQQHFRIAVQSEHDDNELIKALSEIRRTEN